MSTQAVEQYTCDQCGETYDKAWSDEEAEVEARELWTEEERSGGMSIICDDCHVKFMEWRKGTQCFLTST